MNKSKTYDVHSTTYDILFTSKLQWLLNRFNKYEICIFSIIEEIIAFQVINRVSLLNVWMKMNIMAEITMKN